MGRFVAKIFDQAGKNSFLRMLWDKTLPHKMRFSIYQWFSLHLHSIDDCRKRTEILINLLEEPGAYNFDKKEQVIKFLKNNKFGLFSPKFFEIWLEKDSVHDRVFNFNGAFLPYETEQGRGVLSQVFADTFLVSLLFNDDYSAGLVEQLDKVLEEGPYGYIADRFDVTVKRGDIVIDAGAWIGDFSAYAAAKGAFSYAFEPTSKIFKVLQEAAELNRGGGGIYPVKKGLGGYECELDLNIAGFNNAGNTILNNFKTNLTEKIKITTLDNFVHEQNLKKIDFIKADIEGAERDMLKGARGVLKEFAPKLALCTYHLPDDPEVMEALIKDANPDYKVVHIKKKLFAAAVC